LGADFYHEESTLYTERVPTSSWETEYDSCATHDYKGRCQGGTRSVLKRDHESHLVTKNIEVSDGACEQTAYYRFEHGESYALRFTFLDNGACVLTCMRQRRGADVLASEPCKGVPNDIVAAELSAKEQNRERKWDVGARIAYGMPSGDQSRGVPMSEVIEQQTSLEFDAAYRLTPSWALGIDLQYGFGAAGTRVGKSCPWDGGACSIASASFGLQLNYHAMPGRRVDPWVGIGVGFESLVLKQNQSDNQRSLRGWEMLKAQVGLDFVLSNSFAAGPFGALSLGQYTDTDCRADGCTVGSNIDGQTAHQWIFLGVKGAFIL